MNVEQVNINSVIPYARNPRKNELAVDKVASSIKEFGFRQPIVVDTENVIIAGHTRYLAAKKLNINTIPVHIAEGLTKQQVKAYRIADNRVSQESEWDYELLKLELPEIDGLFTGFDQEEIDELLFETVDGLTDEDAVPDVPEQPITVEGDIWLLGNHRLMCGDSTKIDQVERLLDGQKADMVFTDPPYGIDVVQSNQVGGGPTKFGTVGSSNIVESNTYSKIIGDQTTNAAKNFYSLCVEMGFKNIVLWGGNYYTEFLPPSRCWIVWDKEMTGNFSQAEMAWTSFSKGGVKVFKFLWNGLSREGVRKEELKSRIHPTQKPVGLFSDIFNRFDGFKSIYDGFGGSGSTIIACEKTKRDCFMMEIDFKYCDVIVKRWQDFTGKEAILESTNKLFNEAA